jgi:hypothetical protein
MLLNSAGIYSVELVICMGYMIIVQVSNNDAWSLLAGMKIHGLTIARMTLIGEFLRFTDRGGKYTRI